MIVPYKPRLYHYFHGSEGLIYQYKKDCLVASIEYNKDFYSDRDLKQNENILFKLTFVPLGQATIPNVK